MAESLYDQDDIRITSTEFAVADQQYPIREIDSITILKATPARTGPATCIVIGFLGLFVSGLGLIGVIGGVCWLLAQSSKHVIVLNTHVNGSQAASFEVYRSKDINQVREIQLALHQAINHQD